MKNSIILSVIIPCYNSELTINRCLNSICSQGIKDIEIIVVDDGSSDKTINVIRDVMANNKNIFLINQEHSGPSNARFAGIKKAQGKYVMFVDSDDYLVDGSLGSLIDAMNKNSVDCIRFSGVFEKTKKKIFPILDKNEKMRVINGDDVRRLVFTSYALNSMCLQMYKADALKSVKTFGDGISYGEDHLVNMEIHKKTKNMLILNDDYYCYCDNNTSTSHSVLKKTIMNNISNRIFVSKIMINEINNKDCDYRNEAIISQIKMIRDAILRVCDIAGYNKKQFMNDFKKILDNVDFSEIQNKKLFSGLGILRKKKEKGIVEAIVNKDTHYIWRYVRMYYYYRKLRALLWKECV